MQLSKSSTLLVGCISILSTSNALADPSQNTSYLVQAEFSSYDTTFENSQPPIRSSTSQNSNLFMLVDGILKLPTLRQRRGERSELTFEETQTIHASWFRIQNVKIDYGNLRSTAIEFESEQSLVQFGFDFHGHENSFGKWVFGLTGQYATTSSELGFIPQGKPIDSTTFGIGGTATVYDDKGAYIDWQFQYNRVTDISGFTVAGRRFSGSQSSTYTAGVEFGHPYSLSNEITIVPQGQIRWASTFRDKAKLPIISSSRIDQIDGISVRASSAIEYVGESIEAYFLGNFYYDTTRYWKVHYLGRTRDTSSGPMSYEYGIGILLAISEEFALHLDSSYRGDFEKNSDFETKILRLEIGLRHTW